MKFAILFSSFVVVVATRKDLKKEKRQSKTERKTSTEQIEKFYFHPSNTPLELPQHYTISNGYDNSIAFIQFHKLKIFCKFNFALINLNWLPHGHTGQNGGARFVLVTFYDRRKCFAIAKSELTNLKSRIRGQLCSDMWKLCINMWIRY